MVPSRSTSHGAPTRSAVRFQPSIDVVALPGRPETGVCIVRPAVPCQTTNFFAVRSGKYWPFLSGYCWTFMVFSEVVECARTRAPPVNYVNGSEIAAGLEVGAGLVLVLLR